jgi:hypothetical protein
MLPADSRLSGVVLQAPITCHAPRRPGPVPERSRSVASRRTDISRTPIRASAGVTTRLPVGGGDGHRPESRSPKIASQESPHDPTTSTEAIVSSRLSRLRKSVCM